jgi:hypothetical protein
MPTRQRSTRRPVHLARHVVTLAVAILMAAGCSSPSTFPSPSDLIPTPTPAAASASVLSSPTPRVIETPALSTPTPAPVKAHWESAGRMHLARAATHAVRLGDGRVLVVGNEPHRAETARGDSRLAELWDPATDTWRRTAALNKERAEIANALSAAEENWLTLSSQYENAMAD